MPLNINQQKWDPFVVQRLNTVIRESASEASVIIMGHAPPIPKPVQKRMSSNRLKLAA